VARRAGSERSGTRAMFAAPTPCTHPWGERDLGREIGEAAATVTDVGACADATSPTVGGMSMALHLDRDDFVVPGKGRDHGSEVRVDREQASVEQHQWPAAAVDFVVQF
jgi:hypothetical protein